MADLDTRKKRQSAVDYVIPPFLTWVPEPDGSVDDEDRAQLAGVYGAGLLPPPILAAETSNLMIMGVT